MAGKIHVNMETGRSGVCRATKKGCPLGAGTPHFDSKEEAQVFIENVEAKKNQLFSQKSKAKSRKTIKPIENFDELYADKDANAITIKGHEQLGVNGLTATEFRKKLLEAREELNHVEAPGAVDQLKSDIAKELFGGGIASEQFSQAAENIDIYRFSYSINGNGEFVIAQEGLDLPEEADDPYVEPEVREEYAAGNFRDHYLVKPPKETRVVFEDSSWGTDATIEYCYDVPEKFKDKVQKLALLRAFPHAAARAKDETLPDWAVTPNESYDGGFRRQLSAKPVDNKNYLASPLKAPKINESRVKQLERVIHSENEEVRLRNRVISIMESRGRLMAKRDRYATTRDNFDYQNATMVRGSTIGRSNDRMHSLRDENGNVFDSPNLAARRIADMDHKIETQEKSIASANKALSKVRAVNPQDKEAAAAELHELRENFRREKGAYMAEVLAEYHPLFRASKAKAKKDAAEWVAAHPEHF